MVNTDIFFDCLVSVAELEKAANPDRVLGIWKLLLIKNGRLLLGMNNRFGIRYFAETEIHIRIVILMVSKIIEVTS